MKPARLLERFPRSLRPSGLKALWYLVVLCLLVWAMVLNRGLLYRFHDIARIEVPTLFLVSALFVLLQTVSAYRMNLICLNFSVRMEPVEWIGLVWIKSFFNLLPMNAGVASNAVYLKVRHGFSLTSFVNSSILVADITTMIYAFLGLFFALVRFLQSGTVAPSLVGVLLSLFVAGILLLISPLPELSAGGKIGRLVRQAREGLDLLRKDRSLLAVLVGLQFVHFLLFFLIFLVLFRDLGYGLDGISVGLVVVFYNLVQVVTIVPGNLGFREALAGGVSHLLGFSFMDGMLGAVAFGLISITWDVLVGAFFTVWLTRSKAIS
ncbi:MAG: flippase-like domain-containing protein [Deltaproteobacteria bacterium]|nr:flippase-like domain-containing protein [Deltaproteobacteria bacterium]